MMRRMEEATANTEQLTQLITATLFIGGLIAAVVCFRLHRKNPPDSTALIKTLTDQSWATLQIGLLLATFFLLYGLASFAGLLFYEEQIPTAQLAITLLIYSILTGVIATINRRHGGRLGLGIENLRKLILAPLFYLAFIPFLLLASKGYHLLLEAISGSELELQEVAKRVSGEHSWLEVGYILMAIFIAPIYEELIFRGVAFPYFVKRAGLKGGIVLVSLLFALLHFHLPSFLPLALLSAALCLAYWRTGSLWVSIGMHMIFNGVTILALNVAG